MSGQQQKLSRLIGFGLVYFSWLMAPSMLRAQEEVAPVSQEGLVEVDGEGSASLPSVAPDDPESYFDPSHDPNMREGVEDSTESNSGVPFSLNFQDISALRDRVEGLLRDQQNPLRLPTSEGQPAVYFPPVSK